jgi:hypothetical protein
VALEHILKGKNSKMMFGQHYENFGGFTIGIAIGF